MKTKLIIAIVVVFVSQVGLRAQPSTTEPKRCALRILAQQDGDPEPNVVGTGSFVTHQGNHYVVTAYHVVRSRQRLFLAYNNRAGYADLRTIVRPEFVCAPSTELCVFRCKPEGVAILTDPTTFNRAAVQLPLNQPTIPLPDGTELQVIGNPVLTWFGGSELAARNKFFNRLVRADVFDVEPAGDLLHDAVLGAAQQTPIIVLASPYVTYGFSGGPVFRSNTNHLVGMLVGGDPVGRLYCWAVPADAIRTAINGPGTIVSLTNPTWPESLFRDEAATVRTLYSDQKELQSLTETETLVALTGQLFASNVGDVGDDPNRDKKVAALRASIQGAETAISHKRNPTANDAFALSLAKATVAFADKHYQMVVDLLSEEVVKTAYHETISLGEQAQSLRAFALLRQSFMLANQTGYGQQALAAADASTEEFANLAKRNPEYQFSAVLPKAARGFILAKQGKNADALSAFRKVLVSLSGLDFNLHAPQKVALTEVVLQGTVLTLAQSHQYGAATRAAQSGIAYLETAIPRVDDPDSKRLLRSYHAVLLSLIGLTWADQRDYEKAIENYEKAIGMQVGLVFVEKQQRYKVDLLQTLKYTTSAIFTAEQVKDRPYSVASAKDLACSAYKRFLDVDPTVFRNNDTAWRYGSLLFGKVRANFVDKKFASGIEDINTASRVLQVPPQPSEQVTKLRDGLEEMRTLLSPRQ